MLDDASTYNLFTSRPSGPVCGVISFLPNNFLDASANSSILFKIFTPPALPLPPACIWAFKTNFSVFND